MGFPQTISLVLIQGRTEFSPISARPLLPSVLSGRPDQGLICTPLFYWLSITCRSQDFRVYAGILVIFFFHTVVLCLLLGFDFDYFVMAVMSTYLLTAHICFLVFVIAGMQWCFKKIEEPAMKRVALVLFLVTGVLSPLVNWRFNDRSDDGLNESRF